MSEHVADGTDFPWAQDLDGVWHSRPSDDEWLQVGDVQAHGTCGAAFASVHVSSFQPIPGANENLCPDCTPTPGADVAPTDTAAEGSGEER